ncbi:hypothetical protein NK718_09860 [Alsobacter sp. SYSU M60028]|uniref:Transposase n=1 Tax=Alsobacter ponti TaxID=2962936 RepID=A0ABT1LBF3_9HYPH|nr:hypothetical protein [Alsobacter ponti]MCP8938819.1 hypothetical protein [Alsobacter ponti]
MRRCMLTTIGAGKTGQTYLVVMFVNEVEQYTLAGLSLSSALGAIERFMDAGRPGV